MSGMSGVIFRRVPAACAELLESQLINFPAQHGSLQADADKPACMQDCLKKGSLSVSAQRPALFFFCFRVSRFNKVARRNEEECHMHIAYSFRQTTTFALHHCDWLKHPEKERLPCIVGPPGMRAPRTPALLVTNGRSGHCVFVGTITGPLRHNKMSVIPREMVSAQGAPR